jgi:hypothetical protein
MRLQAAWRGHAATARVGDLRRRRTENAAARALQTRQRARSATRAVKRKRRDELERGAATKIQALARAVVARDVVDSLHEARERKRDRRGDPRPSPGGGDSVPRDSPLP